MAFLDFPFSDDLPSFLDHTDVQNYIKEYAEQFKLKPYIKVGVEFISCRSWMILLCKAKTAVSAYCTAVLVYVICNLHGLMYIMLEITIKGKPLKK